MMGLSISQAQMNAMNRLAEDQYILRLTDEVDAAVPLVLTGLHRPGRERMVRAGVARARGYGLVDETHLTRFVTTMIVNAPDFDGQAVIHDQLTRNGTLSNNRFTSELLIVPRSAWLDAIKTASGAGWFLPLPLPRTRRLERLAAALPGAIADCRGIEAAEAASVSEAALAAAGRHGFQSEDAAWVIAVGLTLTGGAEVDGLLGTVSPGAGNLAEDQAVGLLRITLRQRWSVWTK